MTAYVSFDPPGKRFAVWCPCVFPSEIFYASLVVLPSPVDSDLSLPPDVATDMDDVPGEDVPKGATPLPEPPPPTDDEDDVELPSDVDTEEEQQLALNLPATALGFFCTSMSMQ